MKKHIKIGSILLIGFCFLFLLSCEKKQNPKDQYSDTIKSGKLGLILYQAVDTIKINVKSLIESSTEDYKFVFLKKGNKYNLIKQNMFGYFDLSQINVLNGKKLDTILFQSNDLYDSQVTIRQEKIDNQKYKLYICEKPAPEKSLEIIYNNDSLSKIQLVFFKDKYTFDLNSSSSRERDNRIK